MLSGGVSGQAEQPIRAGDGNNLCALLENNPAASCADANFLKEVVAKKCKPVFLAVVGFIKPILMFDCWTVTKKRYCVCSNPEKESVFYNSWSICFGEWASTKDNKRNISVFQSHAIMLLFVACFHLSVKCDFEIIFVF